MLGLNRLLAPLDCGSERLQQAGSGCSGLESARSRPVSGAQGLTGSFVADTLPKQAPSMGW
jgi:hypothetical protein